MASVCAIRSLAGGSKFAMMLPYRRYDMDLRDERELALQRLRVLCHSGLFSILDFRHAVAFLSAYKGRALLLGITQKRQVLPADTIL